MYRSSHHIMYFEYITILFTNYTSIKLEKKVENKALDVSAESIIYSLTSNI